MEAIKALAPLDSPADLADDLAAFHEASFGWALTCARFDRQEAEEVLQAAYLKVLDGRARFDGDSSLRTWFFGVVRWTSVERRRGSAERRTALVRWFVQQPGPPPMPTPELVSSDRELRRRLCEQLARLSMRQREVLHLVFYQELTIGEAALVLSVSIGSARRHYERGKARLRVMLAGVGET
jgi:RNA polymerase sigma-70 factor (ECF subfamily)